MSAESGQKERASTTPPRRQPLHRLSKEPRNLRDLSCRLLCSLRLNARAQNVHLYLRSGVGFCAVVLFEEDDETGAAVAAAGMAGVGADKTALSWIRVLVRNERDWLILNRL